MKIPFIIQNEPTKRFNNVLKNILSLLLITYLISSCSDKFDFDPDVEDATVSSGSANFSKYIALGNSLTSGYMDGTVYSSGQTGSYPNIVATQMQLAGGGAFKQPLMPNDVGGFTNLPGFPGKLSLQLINGSLTPVAAAPAAALDNVATSGPYQNLGVPGAKSFHLTLNGYGSAANLALGTANPFYVRHATSTTSNVVADAMVQTPTFFSLWIGNNDVLGYATSGGTGIIGGTGSSDITSTAMFTAAYTGTVNTLVSGGAKGVLANLPYVSSIPFFTTVPYNPLTPATLSANLTTLNAQLYGPLKTILTAAGEGSRINLLSSTANNPLLIIDKSLTSMSTAITTGLTPSLGAAQAAAFGAIFGKARQATSEDLILLITRSVIGTTAVGVPSPINVYGISYPLQDAHVLTKSEVTDCTNATNAFNGVIKTLADNLGLAFYDANAEMQNLQSGMTFNGQTYTTTYVTGGSFSLDGVHPNGRGYAIIANGFIKAINAKYGSTLPQVDPNIYKGVTFP